MKLSTPTTGLRPVVTFFKRFHAIIFFLIVSACLFVAIVLLLPVTNLSTTQSQPAQTVDASFDQATIDKLRSSSSSTIQPGERTNPFNE